MKEITDAFGYWFSGFTDGEGCFFIGKRIYKNSYATYGCQFTINLRDDDRLILEKICNTLGIGSICDKRACPNNGKNNRPQSAFFVGAINDCAELVKLFDKYPLQAKKQNDFAIWKLAVAELAKPVKCRDGNLLDYYFLKIREVRKYEVQEELVKPKKIEIQLTIEFS